MWNMHDIAFINVKFNLPLGFSVTKRVRILLYVLAIIQCINFPV